MKTLGGIGSIILGVVAILVSVGLQTIWAPPAEFNASTQDAQEAPLTVVTEGIDVDPDEAIEYTVSGEGEFTLMYGQLRDIEAWVGDAAHNRIDGVNTEVERGEDPTVDMTYVDGDAEVPNPADSDLWLATQEVSDEVTQRWAQHDAGEWGLLIAADGTEPAPADFSVSWVNVEPDSPFITPLMIGGIVLILVGIGLLLWRFVDFRRRAKRTSGRRAAVRGDYTGLTAADVMADTDTATQTMTVQEVEAGEPVEHVAEDEPTTVVSAVDASEGEREDESGDSDDMDDADDAEDSDDSDNGSTPTDTTQTLPHTDEPDDDKGFLRRTVTAVTAFGLAIGMGIGPAHAASESPQETSEEDLTEQVEEEPVEEEVDPEEPDTFPLVVDPQFERILESVVSTLDAADSEMDADVLDDRVAGQAKRFRDEFYRNNTIDEDYGLGTKVASDDVLATWMDRNEDFPRTIYAVTADAEGGSTQLLALKQENARSQYKLVHNVPFAPGAELPSGDLSNADVEKIANDDSTDLAMSPDAAVEALTDYLTDPEADAAEDMASNDWIDSIHEHQAELIETHEEQETDASISRTVFDDSVDSVRLPDGSALVFGSMNSMESLTPSEDTTVTVNTLTQELGDFASAEQENQVRIRYREQFALLIPAEGEVSLVGYETVQSTVDSPDN
ncbi:hypothetical protein [Yaniella halotolerans]|uniref:hypothetical protein n=1 Tax=Yaniella halotolerans TaxID=225453 RepID=UPI0003B7540A|nr:hypothetical protein [Yaniella halotolerans]